MQKVVDDKKLTLKLLKVPGKILTYHALIWMIFITYELGTLFAMVGLKAHYSVYLFYYLLYISLFYFNAHVILNHSFFKSRRPYLTAAILILLEVVCFGVLKAGIDIGLKGGSSNLAATVLNKAYVLSNIFRQVFFIGFSTAYWSLLAFRRVQDLAQKMEVEQLREHARNLELQHQYASIENAYLQQQVSPHLLFNSLNFIYYAVYKLSDRAGRGLMLLSELLRYSLTTGTIGKKWVELELEVHHVNQLIELDRMRFKGKRYLSFTHHGDVNIHRVLPLALLTLVENMIKHGECGDPLRPARAVLEAEPNKLLFTTVNNKRVNHPHSNAGIGLYNLEKRLRNVYGDLFNFEIIEDEETFATKLTIYL